ncbi:thiol reductant ABC exporter subunit CydD [Virgibacillus sp. NKC19-16]|uniref:thiol reductant ABC exporter subunit CydD n=1 Tax=Virgibacillus salidurans TaxID=2831673 RepID=UPI001F218D89|nr:thiol reductant ABC exporter subunit CydD [Virgibacillus sp. NKC19-16]UJL46735.1 thiol reductant ABC exporter subunit CydD [Virgibacillus sp. NKC19-16]
MSSLKEIAFTQKKSMLFLLMSTVVTGAAIIAQAYLIVMIVDGVFLQGASFQEILPALGGLLLVLLARTAFSYMNGRKGIQMAAKVKADFRKRILAKYSRNPMQASLRGQSGQKVSVMMDAVDEIDNYFSQYIPQMIQTSFIPLLVLVVVFTQHVNTGLIMIITAPFIPIFMVIIGMKTKQKSEEQMDELAAFSGRFLDTLQGLTTLKLFGRAKQQKEAIEKSSLGFRDATMEILKVAFTSSFMLELISMLSIGLVALELAIQLIIYESISFFTAFFVLVLVPEFYTSLKELGSTFHNGRSSMGAAKKVADELEATSQAVSWGSESLNKEATPPSIDLRETGYSYGEDQFALTNIDAQIRPYDAIAIVGRTGSGKTTLLHLIAGLIGPSAGDIVINGRSRADYKEREWFDQLSYISQHPYIFSGTIAENIAIGGNADVSRSDVEQAAEKAGIAAMIQSLEDGYDTPVGEAGRGLSGGEQQRLAIARAFLKNPSVILFDEPTTGLDLQTERILQTSINELSENATVITVAHRLHTIKNADQILFLENGELIATGTHVALINSVAEYRAMVTVQQGGLAE